MIKTYYTNDLAEYNARKKAKCNPRSYKESMKFFKKTFKPLKDQPTFIGSESLRLRDYQMDGLNFMLKAWHNGDSLILADEMVGLMNVISMILTLIIIYFRVLVRLSSPSPSLSISSTSTLSKARCWWWCPSPPWRPGRRSSPPGPRRSTRYVT